ncbi:hypothetical protein PN36_11705 [Candidatus Thiomargarita nelsonii]|uniref:GGDEF domain-containing protein n=1 Tax=Candidatus Thiomargarita nelsonii TaxID=1003181 RepID=A0A4E0QPX3_9GAMM|nr:hypothetical protein PN36_11705 [Candidatus Thiomargarita nelsonii]
MTQDKKYFHFTLGAVQEFVAQAQRTRDFWAGSFILSWLAAVAMRSVQKQGGTIIFPKPDDNYLNCLEGQGKNQPPAQGRVPNRFKAAVNHNFKPEAIVDSVQMAWRELAEVVWNADLQAFCQNDSIHRQIWDRQIGGFFEITWALTEASNILDRRKNWRTHFAPKEPGVKCMSMAGWQELSGIRSPNKTELENFWRAIGEKDFLCAIAFVKRRFAVHFENLGKEKKIKMPGGWVLKGWKLNAGVPSLSSLAPESAPFYAILLMDGDSLGKHLTDTKAATKISDALENFTRRVPELVSRHNGFLVYAGGDDVLAILPLEDALSCAKTLRDAYEKAFEGTGIHSTLSGAVEFAHIKMPLTKILRDAHSLLDNVAKDGCGRDAIAVRVWKPGGKAAEWAMPWKQALDDDGRLVIEKVAEAFRNEKKKDFSRKFFYRIRERFDLLNPPKEGKAILDQAQACHLLAADYMASGVDKKRKLRFAKAKKVIDALLIQCRRVIREVDDKGLERLDADAALFVRFLATKGVD